MTNFNVTLNGKVGIAVGRKVAAKIRHSNPDGTGCLGVQSMAFHHHDNNIEIACNVPGHYQIGMVANVDLK